MIGLHNGRVFKTGYEERWQHGQRQRWVYRRTQYRIAVRKKDGVRIWVTVSTGKWRTKKDEFDSRVARGNFRNVPLTEEELAQVAAMRLLGGVE